MSSDKILLEGIRLDVRVGVTEEERSLPQLCGLDLGLESDLRTPGRSGRLQDSIDYAAVFRTVEELCTTGSFCLLEELAELLCDRLLRDYPVDKVKLRLRKLNPFTTKLTSVGIEIKRSRNGLKAARDH